MGGGGGGGGGGGSGGHSEPLSRGFSGWSPPKKILGYVSLRIHPKLCCILPLKVATILLRGSRKDTEHSSHIVKTGVEATC